jgi:hypothetical protein
MKVELSVSEILMKQHKQNENKIPIETTKDDWEINIYFQKLETEIYILVGL